MGLAAVPRNEFLGYYLASLRDWESRKRLPAIAIEEGQELLRKCMSPVAGLGGPKAVSAGASPPRP